MIRTGTAGTITFIGSLHADLPFDCAVGYNAAQAALLQMARTLAREWAPQGVRVNTIVRGGSTLPARRAGTPTKNLSGIGRTLPMGRMGRPEDIGAVRYLCSDAASYVAGAALVVDGALGVSCSSARRRRT